MHSYGSFITAEDELALLEGVRSFVDKEIMPARVELDEDHAAFERVYAGLVRLGIQKRGFSESYGGLGIRSAPLVCAITEEISRGDSGVSLARADRSLVHGGRDGRAQPGGDGRVHPDVLRRHAALRVPGDHRAGRGLQHRGRQRGRTHDPRHRAPGRRRVGDQRREDVAERRGRGRRLLRGLHDRPEARQGRRRADLRAKGREGPVVRQAREEDGHARDRRQRVDPLRRRARARRPIARAAPEWTGSCCAATSRGGG